MARIGKTLPNVAFRIKQFDGKSLKIRNYDTDNGYPQRMINFYKASGTAKKCAALAAKYFNGRGFNNLAFYNQVIGRQGRLKMTPDRLLRLITPDLARLRGFALHINYNMLFEVDSVSYVPFEHCRIGIEEYSGFIALSDRWFDTGRGKRKVTFQDIDFINVYDPDPDEIARQVNAAGGWDQYKGQVFYYSADGDSYPEASIDPVLDDVEAEIDSATTRKNNLKGNFQSKYIYVIKGKPQSDDQDAEDVARVQSFMGPDGDNVIIVFSEDEQGRDVPDIKPIDNALDDKLFQYTDQAGRLAIYSQFNQPAILHSDYNGTNGYNEGQLPQSQEYYNSVTEDVRILLEETFRSIFSNYKENINPENDYKINPLIAVGASLDLSDDRSLIEVIGIGGVQALQGILSDTATTPEQKKNTLIVVFGLTEEEASLLAGTETGTATEN